MFIEIYVKHKLKVINTEQFAKGLRIKNKIQKQNLY